MAKQFLLILLSMAALGALLGCGSEDKGRVYDTNANPHGFPKAACDLLDAIETGQLATYDVITEAFGRLYLENNEMLENRHWQEVIRRLGSGFHRRADSLATRGVQHYTQAAGFYILAAFADPNDKSLSERARLFTAWKETTEGLGSGYLTSPTSDYLPDRLDFISHFVLGDSIEQAFADRYLTHRLLDSAAAAPTFRKVLDGLDPADRALMSFLGYAEPIVAKPLVAWEEPSVGLMAYQFTPVGPERYRGELYFLLGQQFSPDILVELLFDASEQDQSADQPQAGAALHLELPASDGEAGRVGIAHTVFAGQRPQGEFQLSLKHPGADSSRLVTTDGAQSVVRLPVSMRQ